MAGLKVADRARIAGLFADGAKRTAVANALASPLLRWRYSSAATGEILIVPQDLRLSDPSFLGEIELGEYGLAGRHASAGDRSPFDITPPSPQWQHELHGFSWLRHLDADDTPAASEMARKLVMDWMDRHAAGVNSADTPDVSARRIISWISNAHVILDNASDAQYERFIHSFARQLPHIAARWRNAAAGLPRLTCVISLCMGNLALGGYDRQLPEAIKRLEDELTQQVISVRGHIARNPSGMVALLLDLLPLEQCFKARSITPPISLAEAIKIVLATLRHLQLGDTGLARFNGMGARSSAALASVLAYDDLTDPKRAKTTLKRNGYVRLVMGGSVLIMDAGKPPPFECSGAAHAGCLSFEWSYCGENILVNGGTPSGASTVEHVRARSTASHNTLRLNEESSSELVRHTSLETAIGAIPLRGPSTVSVTAEILPEDDDVFAEEDDLTPVGVEAMHDGYLERHGLIHQRRVEFANDGRRLLGTDTLSGHNQSVRLARDLPFAIHFHLPPKIDAQLIDCGRRVKLHLPNGGAVIFAAEGALIGIEPSLFFASSCGPLNTEQIVLRGSTFGESDVAWSFEVLVENV